jgi:hypothetical protein
VPDRAEISFSSEGCLRQKQASKQIFGVACFSKARALRANIGSYSGTDGSRWQEMACAGVYLPPDAKEIGANTLAHAKYAVRFNRLVC